MKIIASKKHNATPLTKYNFPHYYLLLHNTLYYLFITPVRVAVTEDKIAFHTNSFQKVICYGFHLCQLVLYFPYLKGSLQLNLKENPAGIFTVANCLIWASGNFIYSWKFLMCRHELCKLIRIPQCKSTWKVHFGKLFYFSLWLVLSALTTFQIVYRDFQFSWDSLLGTARPALDGMYFNFTQSFYTQSSTKLVALGVFVLFQYRTCVWFMTIVIVVMSAVAANEISRGAMKMIKDHEGPFEDSILVYARAKSIMKDVSEFNGQFLFISFLTLIGYTSENFSVIMLSEKHWLTVTYVGLVSLLGVPHLLTAAAAHAKMEDIEEHLKQRAIDEWSGSIESCCTHVNMIAHLPGCRGVSGGRFFTVTYSFLGEAVTVFLTYFIIMIQFGIGK